MSVKRPKTITVIDYYPVTVTVIINPTGNDDGPGISCYDSRCCTIRDVNSFEVPEESLRNSPAGRPDKLSRSNNGTCIRSKLAGSRSLCFLFRLNTFRYNNHLSYS